MHYNAMCTWHQNTKTASRRYYSEIHLEVQNADIILAVSTVQIYASDTVENCIETLF